MRLIRIIHKKEKVVKLKRFKSRLIKNFIGGIAIGLGIMTSGILAVAVSGTFNSFTSGAVIKSSEVNTNFATLKTAIESIPDWTKSGANASYTSGNVGIGISSPLVPLHIQSNLSASAISPYDSGLTIEADGSSIGRMGIISYTSGTPTLQFYHALNSKASPQAMLSINRLGGFNFYGYNGTTWANGAQILINPAENWSSSAQGTNITFHTAQNGTTSVTEVMRIDHNGRIGLGGVTSPGSPIVVGTSAANGNGASVTAGGTWTNGSSKFTKKNITDLPSKDAAEALMKLEPKIYNYKNEEKETYVGFLAEDVPELVAMNNRKTLSAMDIAAVTVKVVQDQQNTIKSLEKENTKLREEITTLRQSVETHGRTSLRLDERLRAVENKQSVATDCAVGSRPTVYCN